VLGGEAAQAGALRLEHCGPNKIAVIKVLREFLGLGLKEAKDLAESAPCVVADWADPARLALFRAELEAVDARVSSGGEPYRAPAPAPAPAPAGAVVLEHCGPNKIGVIKVVREHTGLGLKDAKELVECAPCTIEPKKPSLRSLRDELLAVGARVR